MYDSNIRDHDHMTVWDRSCYLCLLSYFINFLIDLDVGIYGWGFTSLENTGMVLGSISQKALQTFFLVQFLTWFLKILGVFKLSCYWSVYAVLWSTELGLGYNIHRETTNSYKVAYEDRMIQPCTCMQGYPLIINIKIRYLDLFYYK